MKHWRICLLLIAVLLASLCREKNKDVKIEIYQAFHKDAPILQNEIMIPMHVGRALKKEYALDLFARMIGDDTGDNISEKNERYSELTAMYWMWKNSKADIVGLMHYRRSLNLPIEVGGCKGYLCEIGLTKENVKRLMETYDVIYGKPCNLNEPIYSHYSRDHVIEDLELAVEYVYNKYPEMREAMIKAINGPFFAWSNMYIMKKDILDEYATWLFDVLFGIEAQLSNIDGYQKRTLGFLAERLFTIWLEANKDKFRFLGVDIEERL